jgi:hypothetical protein
MALGYIFNAIYRPIVLAHFKKSTKIHLMVSTFLPLLSRIAKKF